MALPYAQAARQKFRQHISYQKVTTARTNLQGLFLNTQISWQFPARKENPMASSVQGHLNPSIFGFKYIDAPFSLENFSHISSAQTLEGIGLTC